MDRFQEEKAALFEALFRQHYKKLLRQANAYFGYKKQFFHLAENAVQETFSIAFEAYESFKVHQNQEAWLHLVLKRRLYLYMQEIINCRELPFDLDESAVVQSMQADQVDEVNQLLQHEERSELVQRLLRKLNDKERKLVEMFYFEQKSFAEIAVYFHTSDRVVNTQLYRIRKKMKRIFESGVFLLICLFRFHI